MTNRWFVVYHPERNGMQASTSVWKDYVEGKDCTQPYNILVKKGLTETEAEIVSSSIELLLNLKDDEQFNIWGEKLEGSLKRFKDDTSSEA